MSLIRLADAGGEVFNVCAFGADPTGATDTTPRVDEARQAAEAVSGTIFYPPGRFRQDGEIVTTPGKRVRFIGSGESATTIDYRGAGVALTFDNPSNGPHPPPRPLGARFGVAEVALLSIQGTPAAAGAIKLRDGIGSHFERLYLRGFAAGSGILLECWDLFCEACVIADVWFDNCLYGVETKGASLSGGPGGHSSFDEFFADRAYYRDGPPGGQMFRLHGGFNKGKFDCPTMWPNALADQRMFRWINNGDPAEVGHLTIINPMVDGVGPGFALADFAGLGGLVTVVHAYSGPHAGIVGYENMAGLSVTRPATVRSLSLPVPSFTPAGTAPLTITPGVTGLPWDRAVGRELPPDEDAGLTTTLSLPGDLFPGKALTVKVHWAASGGPYGDVVWQVAAKYLSGDLLTPADSWTGPADEVVTVKQDAPNPFPGLGKTAILHLAPSQRAKPGNRLRLYVGRKGTDPDDTHGGGAVVYGVTVEYQSVGDSV